MVLGELGGIAEHSWGGVAVARNKNYFVPVSGNAPGVGGLFDNTQGHVYPELAGASMGIHIEVVGGNIWWHTVVMTSTILA